MATPERARSWRRLRLPPDWVVIGVGMVVTASLASRHLGNRSLWYDEGVSAHAVSGPTSRLVVWIGREPQFGLYDLLLRAWSTVSSTETGLRSLSLAFATLTVPAIHATSRRLFGRRAAAIAVVLLALNGYFLGYAQEARAYALVVLTSMLATLCLVRAIERPDAVGRWRLWGAASVVAGLSHPFGVTIVLAHLIVLIACRRTVPLRTIVLTVALPAGVIIGALGLRLLALGPGRISWIDPPDAGAVLAAAKALAGSRSRIPLGCALVAVVVLIVAAVRARGDDATTLRFGTLTATCLLVVPFAVGLGISYTHPIFITRYVIVALPGLTMLVAAGVSRLPSVLAVAATAVLVIVMLPTARSPISGSPPEDWRRAATLIAEDGADDDLIVTSGVEAISYYFERDLAPDDRPRVLRAPAFHQRVAKDLRPCELERVWVVNQTNGLPPATVEELLSTHEVTATRQPTGLEVTRFDRRVDPADVAECS